MRTPIPTAALLSLLALPGLSRADTTPLAPIDAKALGKTYVCTDGKSHYIGLVPDEVRQYQMYYGDGKHMTIVTHDPSQAVGGLDFQDARFPAPGSNPDFRGIDWRNYSSVAFDKTAGTCSVTCGTKKTPLTVMPRDQGQQLMSSATLEASPRTREPYALARDEHGVYYFVDRGIAADQRQSYRV